MSDCRWIRSNEPHTNFRARMQLSDQRLNSNALGIPVVSVFTVRAELIRQPRGMLCKITPTSKIFGVEFKRSTVLGQDPIRFHVQDFGGAGHITER